MLGLSKSQTKILETIILKINQYGYPPSVREICSSVGLKSTATVHSHLSKLEELGYIKKNPTKSRTIEVLIDNIEQNIHGLNQEIIELPLIEFLKSKNRFKESVNGTIKLPTSLIMDRRNFLFKVKDNKLIETGVFKNDYIIIERTDIISNGNAVLVMTDNEVALGRYFKYKDTTKLKFENEVEDPLILEDGNFDIIGKPIGCFRFIK